MEHATSQTVAESEKSPEELERDMERTRESITEKVAALENQVIGTVQNATDSVSHTVEAVREAVAAAPSAFRDTVREMVDTVKEAINSFSTDECIRSFPTAALCTTTAAGFLAGYFIGGKSKQSSAIPPPLPRPQAAPSHPSSPSLLTDLLHRCGGEMQRLASDSLATGIAALKSKVERQLPLVIDSIVDRAMNFGSQDHTGRNGSHREYGVRAPV